MDKHPTTLCCLAPEQMAGPYFRNPALERFDITEGLPGVRLELTLRLLHPDCTTPLADAWVDIWHCDAHGRYSGWSAVDPNLEAPSGEIGSIPRTDDDTYLRGHQLSDENGTVSFLTIFPGFYAGRATHIHVAVRQAQALHVAYVGQLYFAPLISRLVSYAPVYGERPITRLENLEDELYIETLNRHAGNLDVVVSSRTEPGNRLLGFVEFSLDLEARSEHIAPGDLQRT